MVRRNCDLRQVRRFLAIAKHDTCGGIRCSQSFPLFGEWPATAAACNTQAPIPAEGTSGGNSHVVHTILGEDGFRS